MTHIPDSMEELITLYGALIRNILRATVPHYLQPEDLEDLQATVYMKMLRPEFFPNCHAYAMTDPNYTFVSTVWTVTRNTGLNWIRHQRAACRDVVRGARLTAAKAGRLSSDDHKAIEARADAALRIKRLCQHLKPYVIGRKPAADVIAAALQSDGTLPKYELRRVKHYVEDMHV